MHVLCPSCAAEYEIPKLQRPRKLRCARCGAEWRVMPPAEPLPAGDAAFDGPLPADDMAPLAALVSPDEPGVDLSPLSPLQADGPIAGPDRRRPIGAATLVWAALWVASIVALAAAAFAFWHWRGAIAHGWPPSLRLYRLLPGGMPDGRLAA